MKLSKQTELNTEPFDGSLEGIPITAAFNWMQSGKQYIYMFAGRHLCRQEISQTDWVSMCNITDIADWLNCSNDDLTLTFMIVLSLALVIVVVIFFLWFGKTKSNENDPYLQLIDNLMMNILRLAHIGNVTNDLELLSYVRALNNFALNLSEKINMVIENNGKYEF